MYSMHGSRIVQRILRQAAAPAPLARFAKRVQDFVDALEYNFEEGGETSYSPKQVLEKRRAHCLEGGVFAACALRFHGFPPLLMDLRAKRDDDHTLCIFRQAGKWGAVSKSKFIGLRWRDPVYKTLRELALSYFTHYYNYAGEKTLREFSQRLT